MRSHAQKKNRYVEEIRTTSFLLSRIHHIIHSMYTLTQKTHKKTAYNPLSCIKLHFSQRGLLLHGLCNTGVSGLPICRHTSNPFGHLHLISSCPVLDSINPLHSPESPDLYSSHLELHAFSIRLDNYEIINML